MTERELRLKLEDNLPIICKLLLKGKDVELRKDVNGVRVISIDKKVIK